MNMSTDVTARSLKSIWVIAVILFSNSLFLTTASAQYGTGFPGQMNLPQNDFTWTWGGRRSSRRGIEDISIIGNQAGFRCDLRGKLRVGSRLSRMDVREIESDIRSSMSFVQAAANAMNNLESRGALDWATLECIKPQPAERERNDREETG